MEQRFLKNVFEKNCKKFLDRALADAYISNPRTVKAEKRDGFIDK